MKKEKSMCTGCYDDEYNHGLGGSKECWSYETAKVIKRLCVHMNQSPPYNFEENSEDKLSCYRRPQYCYINKEALNTEGYWK
jgi:hypothetical protein